MRPSFLYLFLFLLSGCFLDQEGKDQSSVEVKLTQNVLDGAAGGAILYLINKDLNIQRSMILTESSLNIQLKQGTWDFALVAWAGDGSTNPNFSGAIKCGLQKGVKLDQASESVSLNFNTSTCNNSFFTPPAHLATGSMLDLKIVNCLTVTNPTPGTYCDSAAKGFAGSYIIKIFAKPNPTPKNKTSFIAALGAYVLNPLTSGVQVLESSCIPASTGAMSTTPVLRVLPFSSSDLFVSAGVEAYSDPSCSSGKLSYIYPIGFGDPSGNVGALTSNTVSKTTATSSSSDIYLAYQPVTLSGSQNFGKVLLSQTAGVSKTLIVTNNSPSPVSLSLPTYSHTDFTIGLNSCPSTLAANTACSIGVKFTPTIKGPQTATLSMTIDGITKTYSYIGFGVKDSFTTYPQGVSGFSALPSNRINSVFLLGSTPITRYAGTDGGLYINSGSTTTTKTTKDGLGSNIINTIYAFTDSTTNYVYAGTSNGLGISVNGGTSFTNKLPSTDIRSVYAEMVGGEHRIYVGTSTGLQVSKDGGTTWGLSSTVTNGVHKLIVVDSTSTSATIYYSNNKDSLYSQNLTFSSTGIVASSPMIQTFSFNSSMGTLTTSTNVKVSDLLHHSGSDVYALVSTGTGSSPAAEGLYKFVTGVFSHQNNPMGTTPVEYAQLSEDYDTNILIIPKGSSTTIKKFVLALSNLSSISLGSTYNFTGISTAISGTTTYFLLGTKSGVLQASGLSAYTSLTWSPTTTGGFKNNKVNSFAVNGSGAGATSTKIIVGTPEGILLTTNPMSLSSINHPTGLLTYDVKAFFADLTNVYFGSLLTTHYVKRTDWASLSPNSIWENRATTFTSEVNDIFVDSTKEYVATQGSGIAYGDKTLTTPSWSWYTTSNGLLSNNIKNIYVNSTGVIYFTYSSGNTVTDSQLARLTFSGGVGTISHHGSSSFFGGTINRFHVDETGAVFLGISNGTVKRWPNLSQLTSTPPATPVSYDLSFGGVSPTINDIYSKWSVINGSNENHIFVGSNLGLHIKLDSISSWTLRTTSHGLPTNNVKKVFVDSEYEIYVGTTGAETEDSGGGLGTTKY